MRASLLLLVALVALPAAAAQPGESHPLGLTVLGGPVVRAPVGERTTVDVVLFNAHPTEARTLRVTIVEIEHLTIDAPAGEGMHTRGEDDVVTVPPLGEATWSVDLLPSGEGSRWRITLGTTEDIEAAAHPVTSFEVDTRPTFWSAAGSLAGWGAGGAALGGAAAVVVMRPGLRGALALPFVGLYTRLRGSDALSQEKRERIYAIVRERPGLRYAELMRATGLGAGVLVHHLRVLERERLVTSRRHGSRRLLFAAGTATEEAPPTDAQQRVLEALRGAPRTQAELRELLSLSQQGVSYHLQNLAREGHVREERVGSQSRWRAVDAPGGARSRGA